MQHTAKSYIVLTCIWLYSFGVGAATDTIKSDIQTANKIAASVMAWYGGAIKNNQHKYSNYPNNIQNIQIVDAVLTTKLNTKSHKPITLFTLTIRLNFLENNQLKSQQIHESFEFDLSKSQNFLKIHRIDTKNIGIIADLSKFDTNYYRYRSFAYAWLVLLDDSSSLLLQKNVKNADYQLEIGNHYYSGSLFTALGKRNLWMGKGQHLLRNISSSIINNNLQLTLIIDWHGVNHNNKQSIAKIKQVIKLKKNNDTYQVLNVKEQHLLPDIAPWEKLLC